MADPAKPKANPEEPPEPPPPPCPRCGEPLIRRAVPYDDGERELPRELCAVLGCDRCYIMGAQVPGIEVVWRPLGPDVREQVIADGWQALRLKRFLDADEWDMAVSMPVGGW